MGDALVTMLAVEFVSNGAGPGASEWRGEIGSR